MIKQKVFQSGTGIMPLQEVVGSAKMYIRCTFSTCQRCAIFNGRKHFDKAKSFFNQAQTIMPLQTVVRQCKNVHSLHIFYFVKGVQYSTDGKHFWKKFFNQAQTIMPLQTVVRQCDSANSLHNFYFIKKCVLPCKNFPMGTKYDRVFSKPY